MQGYGLAGRGRERGTIVIWREVRYCLERLGGHALSADNSTIQFIVSNYNPYFS